MNPSTHRALTLTLVSLALTTGPSLAQNAATLNLGAYRSMAGALDQAVSDRAASGASSLADLDRASAAYASLKPGISSPLLTGGIDRALQSSRTALSRTPAELEAQTDQVRSLMRKALYDQTLGGVGASAAAPLTQAELLASEFGLQGDTRASFLSAVSTRNAGAAARLLRRAAAQKVQGSLASATVPQNPAERAASYLSLASATGWFTVVQDAPDTGGLKLTQFSQALTELTQGDNAALGTSLSTLKSGAAGFVSASARAVQSGVSVPRITTGSAVPVVPVTPGSAPSSGQTAQGQAKPTPATGQSGTVPSGTGQSGTVQSGSEQAGTVPSGSGLSAAQAQQAGLNATYAALARAQTAAGHADLQTARSELGRAAQTLGTSGLKGTDGYDHLSSDLDTLQNRDGVRPGEVQALIAELGTLEGGASAQPTSALDRSSALVARVGTPVVPLLFLLVGLLSLYPLYLLNLAFGGRNSYWRAIAASLGLLFLPVLLEGLGGTLAFLGDLSGIGAFRSLGNLSLFQGAWGLPVWLLLAAGAVALSSYGFRGLCRQFGLLGGSGGSANPTRADTPQPALDWDEEL